MIAPDSLAGGATAGTLYGIGVGPGDARYLTLRAAALVQAVEGRRDRGDDRHDLAGPQPVAMREHGRQASSGRTIADDDGAIGLADHVASRKQVGVPTGGPAPGAQGVERRRRHRWARAPSSTRPAARSSPR